VAPRESAILDGVQSWRPNAARMFDYYVGGKDNFAADRDAARMVLAAAPDVPLAAREHRAFVIRAIHFLVARARIAQFIDIGPGLPTGANVHQIAHRFHPGARVVYVDNDPVVLSHGLALLARQHPAVAMVEGDLREPGKILDHPRLRALIDLGEPAGLCLTLVLDYLPDADQPGELVALLLDRLAPGSYLVLSHVTGDSKETHVRDRITRIYDQASAPLVMRSREEIMGFFTGCTMVPPGLVYVAQWYGQAGGTARSHGGTRWMRGGVGMKTATVLRQHRLVQAYTIPCIAGDPRRTVASTPRGVLTLGVREAESYSSGERLRQGIRARADLAVRRRLARHPRADVRSRPSGGSIRPARGRRIETTTVLGRTAPACRRPAP